ncbi:MAG: cyanophycinase [Bacteriovorax sp.]|nr:cyanophycinase [Bacteriovorax sp.]
MNNFNKFFFLILLNLSICFFATANEVSDLPVLNQIKTHELCKLNIENCKEALGHKSAKLPTYMSRGTGSIEQVVIVIHGTDRNANEYLHDFISELGNDTLLANMAVVAPHFLLVNDPYETNNLRWDQGWQSSWKYGNNSIQPIQVSSFEVIDQLIKNIDKTWHPKKIMIAGHSAGGQFVQRYANGSLIAQEIKSELTFVVSNPSSYLYTRPQRLIENIWQKPNDSCLEYNNYIYGLYDRNAYLAKLSPDEIEKNYLNNNVVYLMGEQDVLSEDLDTSCEANLQGPNRIIRASTFFRYLNEFFPHHSHKFLSVPNVGHDHIKMFSSAQFLSLLNISSDKKYQHQRIKNLDLSIDRMGLNNIDSKKPHKSFYLMGGGESAEQVYVEYLRDLDGGDFLILSGRDYPLDYNLFITNLAKKYSIPLNSVTTVLIHSRNGSHDPRLIKLISESEGIFFSGGDQWKYVERIKDTVANEEIVKKIKTGIPFGGTSAGLAILGDTIFTAEKGSLTTDDVFNNPLDDRITLTSSMFGIPLLKNILTDTHFVVRDRMGRLLSFLANAYHHNHFLINGLGVDEGTTLVLSGDGIGHVLGDGAAYLVRPTLAPYIGINRFYWKNIEVYRWVQNSFFSLVNLTLPHYYFNVDNSHIVSSQENGEIY